jgi:hypothetical protein
MRVLFLAAVSVVFSWTPSATPGVASQWLRCGLRHGGPYVRYASHLNAKRTSVTLKVPAGIPLFCVVTAVSKAGIESGASDEIAITP